MEDILDVLKLSDEFNEKLQLIRVQCLNEVHQLLGGTPTPVTKLIAQNPKEQSVEPSPIQQTKKRRLKRLSSLHEDDIEEETSMRESLRASNSKLLAAADAAAAAEDSTVDDDKSTVSEKNNGGLLDSTSTLMPPPPVPDAAAAAGYQGRPQRAAKLNCKSFKEPTINGKMRRPSKNDEVQIKLEQEQRKSQIESNARPSEKPSPSLSATTLPASNSVETGNETVEEELVNSEKNEKEKEEGKEESTQTAEGKTSLQGKLRIKIKREKLSVAESVETPTQTHDTPDSELDTFKTPLPLLPPTVATAAAAAVTKKDVTVADESTLLSSTVSTTNTTTNTMDTVVPGKKNRKKKDIPHRPIKVERFSEIGTSSPIATRTRRGNTDQRSSQSIKKSQSQSHSIYEDAIGEPIAPPTTAAASDFVAASINETVNLPNATMTLGAAAAPAADATFALPNANATITIDKTSNPIQPGDTTFDIVPATHNGDDKYSSLSSNGSMVTAKAGSPDYRQDSLMTEDNSFVAETPTQPLKVSKPTATTTKGGTKSIPIPQMHLAAAATSANKPLKMTNRAHELFNPNVQSPVKMRVEAFEAQAAAAAEEPRKNMRSRVAKENATSSSTTPVIGKLPLPTLGRFLTPTQSSNLPLLSSAQHKKAPMSASKVPSVLPKSASASNLKATTSTSSKTLARENSNDDFRKGLHQLAEERKKQREQKHLLAAKQREAKERERAERIAKLEKERAEKRLRKVKEKEQTKRELDELNRKIRQQEEAEALKKAKAKAAQEQEMLQQMKHQQQQQQQQQNQQVKHKQMLPPPPPPKVQTKYTFEMLHEDDSTDDEGKVSYKRPPVPSWSRSHIRGPAIQLQQYCPTEVIDSFFSVEPTTPDLKEIFPNIDPRHLKRNSSVLWNTPPRYSELPKY